MEWQIAVRGVMSRIGERGHQPLARESRYERAERYLRGTSERLVIAHEARLALSVATRETTISCQASVLGGKGKAMPRRNELEIDERISTAQLREGAREALLREIVMFPKALGRHFGELSWRCNLAMPALPNGGPGWQTAVPYDSRQGIDFGTLTGSREWSYLVHRNHPWIVGRVTPAARGAKTGVISCTSVLGNRMRVFGAGGTRIRLVRRLNKWERFSAS